MKDQGSLKRELLTQEIRELVGEVQRQWSALKANHLQMEAYPVQHAKKQIEKLRRTLIKKRRQLEKVSQLGLFN